MANYSTLKSAINNNITTNGNEEITGAVLNGVLQGMVTALGAGYQYMGDCDTSTDPGTPDARVFYLAVEAGTYSNFGGTAVTEPTIFYYDTSWHSQTLDGDFSATLRVADIINTLNSTATDKPLAAAQGKVLSDEIKQLDDELYGVYGFADIAPTLLDNQYYVYSSNKINVDTNVVATSKCARISVTAGEKFKIFGKDLQNATAYRLWCFSDGTAVNGKYSALSVADANIDTRQDGVIITAPEGSVYLSIAFYQYDSSKDKIQKWGKVENGLVDKVKFESGQNLNDVIIADNLTTNSSNDVLSAKQGKVIGDELFDKYGYVEDMDAMEDNRYYNTNLDHMESSIELSGTNCIRLNCIAGDKFKIYGKGSSSAIQLYSFTNSNRIILYKPDEALDSRTEGLVVTAPEGSGYLYVNFYQYEENTDHVQRYVKTSEGLEGKVAQLQKIILNGKNIVIFGDSLSEFKYDGRGWCDWATEISKANFINCAIGGTQFRQRRALITLFNEEDTYNVGDWVYYKPSTTMNCYECTAPHSGAWDSNDFSEVTYNYYIYSPLDIVNLIKATTNTEISTYSDRFVNQEAAVECIIDHMGDNNTSIINALKAIDWSKIDAVICMAGANDYNEIKYGTTGSDDINTTLGAINEIVRMLNSTYKNVPIYLVTETVRWFNYSSGSGSDSDWCDIYVPSGGTLTYKEFFALIGNEGRLNHIPVIDLYNTLGWNKWNFSNFFTDNDGTHPYKGFRQIAEKIVSFIISNKIFNG